MATIPDELLGLFQEPALAHVSYLNRKGQIVTFPMWVDYDGEHLQVSSPVGSRKGRAFRERPQVSVSIVSNNNPWRWLSASGRVVGIQPDENLEFIDRLAPVPRHRIPAPNAARDLHHRDRPSEPDRRAARSLGRLELDIDQFWRSLPEGAHPSMRSFHQQSNEEETSK